MLINSGSKKNDYDTGFMVRKRCKPNINFQVRLKVKQRNAVVKKTKGEKVTRFNIEANEEIRAKYKEKI
jgi:hypothetical protein